MLFSKEAMLGSTLDPSRLNIFIDSLDSFLLTYAPRRAYSMMVGTLRLTSMKKAFVAPPKTSSILCLDRVGPAILGWIGLTWGLRYNYRGWSGFWIVSDIIGVTSIWPQILGSVPTRTWLALLTNVLPSALDSEDITRKEDSFTSKGSHQSTITLLHLAQLFRQISVFVALNTNMELLEASALCRQVTLLVVPFSIITRDTVPRA